MSKVQLQTRAGKASALCTHWMQYIFRAENKPEALSDLRVWFLTTFAKSRLTDYEIPWMPFPLTRWLQNHLQSTMSIFEWGSGASTVFFAKQVNHVVSIEYDQLWHKRVVQLLKEKSLTNVDLHYVAPETIASNLSGELAIPKSYRSKSFPDLVFFQYVSSILQYPNKHFDLILVDGRARMACLELAFQKVKDYGIILLDNSERHEYQQYQELLPPGWATQHFNGPVPSNIWPVFGRTTMFSQSSTFKAG